MNVANQITDAVLKGQTSAVGHLTDGNFQEAVKGSFQQPVLIDFSATWCAPCRALKPQIERVAQEEGSRLSVFEVDVDQAPVTQDEFNINTVPTMLLFKNGEEVERLVGFMPKPEIMSRLSKAL